MSAPELWGLFSLSFLSASLLPGSSELLLLGLLANGRDPALVWMIATLGNTLGAVLNWLLGRFLMHFSTARWFPVSEAAIEQARERYQRWGLPSLLLAWLPVIGDPLTLVGGMMRTPLWLFIALVGLGKGLRYLVLCLPFVIN